MTAALRSVCQKPDGVDPNPPARHASSHPVQHIHLLHIPSLPLPLSALPSPLVTVK